MIEREILATGLIKYSNVFPQNKEILELFKKSEGIDWMRSAVSDYHEGEEKPTAIVNSESRNSYTAIFTPEKVNTARSMATKLQFSMSPFVNDFCKEYGASYYWIESLNFLKYEVGNYFKAHVDAGAALVRRISLVYYFNDDYEGGEVEFSNQGVSLKPKANELLIFPSDHVFLHEVKPITSGVKYSVATWLR